MKVKEAAGSKCFVMTLNRSDNALPEAILNASAPVSNRLFLVLCVEHFYARMFIAIVHSFVSFIHCVNCELEALNDLLSINCDHVRLSSGLFSATDRLPPGFHSNAIACARNKRKRQPIGMLGRSSSKHDWLLANASACVSCGFRLRNARNASDCV